MFCVAHCEERGRIHVKNGMPCQDKTYHMEKNGVCVIALSDGAGSAAYSEIGAEITAHTSCEFICDMFDELFYDSSDSFVKHRIVDAVKTKLMNFSIENEISLKELASTLLLVAVKDDKFFLAQIGDGVIGAVQNGELKTMSNPKNGEFINTTVFITSELATDSMTLIRSKQKIDAFVLMSDGTEASLYDRKTKELAPVVAKLMKSSAFYSSDMMNSMLKNRFQQLITKKTGDDCSIIIMSRENAFPQFADLDLATKGQYFGITKSSPSHKRRIKQYADIIYMLKDKPATIQKLSNDTHINKKYMQKKIDKLLQRGLIVKTTEGYKSVFR